MRFLFNFIWATAMILFIALPLIFYYYFPILLIAALVWTVIITVKESNIAKKRNS